MWQSEELDLHLKTSNTIHNNSLVFVEWNMNDPQNIEKLGNYRYRPGSLDTRYSTIVSVYDPYDSGNHYTGATDSDIVVDGGTDDNDTPITLVSQSQRMGLLYSLEDCIKPNRPRSGINKMLYLGLTGSTDYTYNQYIDDISRIIARRPRYYLSSKNDSFKYWTSFRFSYDNGENVTRGISYGGNIDVFYIDDAAPFVVYKDEVPTNKIVVKMQTNVGEETIGSVRVGDTSIPDPLYGDSNRTVPRRWKIQTLKNDVWEDAISFNDSSVRKDGSVIVGADGYVELSYGLEVPELFQDSFSFVGSIGTTDLLPEEALFGETFLYKQNQDDIGVMYTYTGILTEAIVGWTPWVPEYTWFLSDQSVRSSSPFVKNFVDPDFFIQDGKKVYREVDFIRGIRIVAETMNRKNCTFDLIEMSPRLCADITDSTMSFSITKPLSDLGTTALPVGNILAAIGSVDIFDDNHSFNANNVFNKENNSGSIIAKYLDLVAKFSFYDVVKNVNGYNYYIPVKSMYSSGFPQVNDSAGTLSVSLRDLFYLLESEKAPSLLLTDISISYAITVLLDSIGFSNYVFKRVEDEGELVIPFFFANPENNVAQVLEQLAVSSQSAMFFDEYNNLVIMSKNYLLPTEEERQTDSLLLGQEYESENGDTYLPNIINLSSQDKKIINAGQINYTTRYINRSIGSISQAPYVNEYQTYIYKPSLLWEVSGAEKRQSINDVAAQSSGYSLAAVPLNTALTASIPTVSGNSIINNIIDLGENVYWLQNFAGYLYANGEIIRYDAIEYSVQNVGTVWVSSNKEYQDYMSKLVFNGKMFPTGNVRIYSEPEYLEKSNGVAYMKSGPISKNGRGQFGTQIVRHEAGIPQNSTWTSNSYVRGCIQDTAKYLFSMNDSISYPVNRSSTADAGKYKYVSGNELTANTQATSSTRTGIIKNFLANKNDTEDPADYTLSTLSGSVQASALVFNGPTDIPADLRQADLVSYVYKPMSDKFSHFGTRMRIVGKIESGSGQTQTPLGGFSLLPSDYVTSSDPSKSVTVVGGSGGIGVGVNPSTNVGYYFEIVALSADTVSQYTNNSSISSYIIAKYPEGTITTVVDNLVTVTTEKVHDFNKGDRVVVSGLIDYNNQSNTLFRANGEFEITEVGSNRKSFQYIIPSPETPTATIINSSRVADKITYNTSAQHDFSIGDTVTITGASNAEFNKTKVVITEVSNPDAGPWSFSIKNPDGDVDPSASTGGTATYVFFNTQCRTGGTATKVTDGELSISNVFFYKVVSGANTSEILKRSRFGNLAKVTTLSPHSFVNGEKVVLPVSNNSTTTKTVTVKLFPTPKTLPDYGGQTAQTNERTFYFDETGADVAEVELSTLDTVKSLHPSAITEVLWKGFAEINVDDGKFTGQTRFSTTESPTVYDLAVEYTDIGENRRRFYLYINGKQVSIVEDLNALAKYNNIALFVRGASNCMFENVYALDHNYSQNTGVSLQLPVSKVFGDSNIDSSDALTKYSLSGFVQQTYLTGISSQGAPAYKIYFEEFGTIMREVAHFNIKYDRAYPALTARLAPTLNRVKGYAVSGFYADPYGADFLVFNCIDKNLNLDDTTGNYLRIHGIAFTQSTTYTLTVDDYFKKTSSFSDPGIEQGTLLYNPLTEKRAYDTIRQSRMKYGYNEFTLEAPYIQTTSAAEDVLGWTINKVMTPRKLIGLNTFATQNLQLGDIVKVIYEKGGVDVISDESKRYVVYNIDYKKDAQVTTQTLYLAEV